MPISYNVSAAILNESETTIERLVATITKVAKHCEHSFLKTHPLPTHSKNLRILSTICDEFNMRDPYLGISFKSYGWLNYIHFTSSLKKFTLQQGDELVFVFDDKEELRFTFSEPCTKSGHIFNNQQLIKDAELRMLQSKKLEYWKLVNNTVQTYIVGGFSFNEHNKQYKSNKVGQRILQLMAEKILTIKEFILA